MLATGLVAAVAVASIPGTAVAAEQDWPLWLQLTLANVSFSAWSLWLILIPLTLLCFPAGRLGTWPVRVIAIITIVGGTGILLLSLADPGIDAWVAGFDIPADGPLFAAGSIAVLGDTVVASALPLLPLLFVVQSAAFVGMVVVLTARFARGDDRVVHGAAGHVRAWVRKAVHRAAERDELPVDLRGAHLGLERGHFIGRH